MKEIWKDILNYEGLYQASTFGKIKSLKRNNTNGKILKPFLNSNGYLYITLSKNGKCKNFKIHKIIASTFIGEPTFDKKEIRHLNGNRFDNNSSNLKYGNRSEQMKDRIKHGTHFQPDNKGSKQWLSKLMDSDILEIIDLIKLGWSDTKIAIKYNVCRQTINGIRNHKTWRHVNA
jgi:hypothetical protein